MLHAAVLIAITLSYSPADVEEPGKGAPNEVSQEKAESQSDAEERKTPDDGTPEFDLGAETASHEEMDPLPVKFGSLTSLRLDAQGDLLACDGAAKQIKVIGSDGSLKSSLTLDFGPEVIDVAPDGTIYCGGQGWLAHLTKSGQVLHAVKSPTDAATEDEKPGTAKKSEKRRQKKKSVRLSGIAVSGDHVFVAIGLGGGTGSKSELFRFDTDLQNPTQLAQGLRACCQRCDITALDGTLFLAENAAHRVVIYDSAGEVLRKWGERSRTELEGFGSCCNPMNLCFGADGVLYTSESGLGRVKRYSIDGQYLGLVGYVGTARFTRATGMASSCSNIAIDVTPDGKIVYVMDFRNNMIRVLRQKSPNAARPATTAPLVE